MRYICDCGAEYGDTAAVIMCADAGHGRPPARGTYQHEILTLRSALEDLIEHAERVACSHGALERERGSMVGTLTSNAVKAIIRARAALSRATGKGD